MSTDYFDVVFDGPPEHDAGRFVEVEDSEGYSISVGEWIHRDDGYWALRINSESAIKACESRLLTDTFFSDCPDPLNVIKK